MNEQQYNIIAEQYDIFIRTAPMRLIDNHTIISMVGDVENKKILDLACGSGYFTNYFSRNGASYILGVDISEEMVMLAKEKSKKSGGNVHFEVKDASTIGVIDSFDIVIAIWLLNYATTNEMLSTMIKACHDNLKPGGKLVIYTVNPDYKLEKGNYTKYGFNILDENKVGDMTQYRAEFLTPIPSYITFNGWSKYTYEKYITSAGFSSFEWVTPQIPKVAYKNQDPDFWMVAENNNLQTGIICVKDNELTQY